MNNMSRASGGLSNSRSASTGYLPRLAQQPSFITTNDVRPAGIQSSQVRKGSMFSSSDSLRSAGTLAKKGAVDNSQQSLRQYNYRIRKADAGTTPLSDRSKQSTSNYHTFEKWRQKISMPQRLSKPKANNRNSRSGMESSAFFSPKKGPIKRTHMQDEAVIQDGSRPLSQRKIFTSPRGDGRFMKKFASGNSGVPAVEEEDYAVEVMDTSDSEQKRQAYQETMKMQDAIRNEQLKIKTELSLIQSTVDETMAKLSSAKGTAARLAETTPSKKVTKNGSLLFPPAVTTSSAMAQGYNNLKAVSQKRYLSPLYGADVSLINNDHFIRQDEAESPFNQRQQELPTSESRLIYGAATDFVPPSQAYYSQPKNDEKGHQKSGQKQPPLIRPQSIKSDSMLHEKKNALSCSKADLIVELMSPNLQSEQLLFKQDNKESILIDNFHRVHSSQTNFQTNSTKKAQTTRVQMKEESNELPKTSVSQCDNTLGKKTVPNSNQASKLFMVGGTSEGRNDNRGSHADLLPQLFSKNDSNGASYPVGRERTERLTGSQSVKLLTQNFQMKQSESTSCHQGMQLPWKNISSNSGNMHNRQNLELASYVHSDFLTSALIKQAPITSLKFSQQKGQTIEKKSEVNQTSQAAPSLKPQDNISQHENLGSTSRQQDKDVTVSLDAQPLPLQNQSIKDITFAKQGEMDVSRQDASRLKTENSCNKIEFQQPKDDSPLRSNQRKPEKVLAKKAEEYVYGSKNGTKNPDTDRLHTYMSEQHQKAKQAVSGKKETTKRQENRDKTEPVQINLGEMANNTENELQSEAHFIFPEVSGSDHHIPTPAQIQQMIKNEVQSQINRDLGQSQRKSQTPVYPKVGSRKRMTNRSQHNQSQQSMRVSSSNQSNLLSTHRFGFQRDADKQREEEKRRSCTNCNDSIAKQSDQPIQEATATKDSGNEGASHPPRIFMLPNGQLMTTEDPKNFVKLTTFAGPADSSLSLDQHQQDVAANSASGGQVLEEDEEGEQRVETQQDHDEEYSATGQPCHATQLRHRESSTHFQNINSSYKTVKEAADQYQNLRGYHAKTDPRVHKLGKTSMYSKTQHSHQRQNFQHPPRLHQSSRDTPLMHQQPFVSPLNLQERYLSQDFDGMNYNGTHVHFQHTSGSQASGHSPMVLDQQASQQQPYIQPVIKQIDSNGNVRVLDALPEYIKKKLVEQQLQQTKAMQSQSIYSNGSFFQNISNGPQALHTVIIESEEGSSDTCTAPSHLDTLQSQGLESETWNFQQRRAATTIETDDRSDKTDSKQDLQFNTAQAQQRQQERFNSMPMPKAAQHKAGSINESGRGGFQQSEQTIGGAQSISSQIETNKQSDAFVQRQQRPREMTFATNSSPSQHVSQDTNGSEKALKKKEIPLPSTPPLNEEKALRQPAEKSPDNQERSSPQSMRNEFPFVAEKEPLNQIKIPYEAPIDDSCEERAPRVDRGADMANLVIRAEIIETEEMLLKESKNTVKESQDPEETSEDDSPPHNNRKASKQVTSSQILQRKATFKASPRLSTSEEESFDGEDKQLPVYIGSKKQQSSERKSSPNRGKSSSRNLTTKRFESHQSCSSDLEQSKKKISPIQITRGFASQQEADAQQTPVSVQQIMAPTQQAKKSSSEMTQTTPEPVKQLIAPIMQVIAVPSSSQVTQTTPECVQEMLAPIRDAQHAVDPTAKKGFVRPKVNVSVQPQPQPLQPQAQLLLAQLPQLQQPQLLQPQLPQPYLPPHPQLQQQQQQVDQQQDLSSRRNRYGQGASKGHNLSIQQSTQLKDLFPTLGYSSSADDSGAVQNLEKTISAIKNMGSSKNQLSHTQPQNFLQAQQQFLTASQTQLGQNPAMMTADSRTAVISQNGTNINIQDHMPSQNDSFLSSVLKIQGIAEPNAAHQNQHQLARQAMQHQNAIPGQIQAAGQPPNMVVLPQANVVHGQMLVPQAQHHPSQQPFQGHQTNQANNEQSQMPQRQIPAGQGQPVAHFMTQQEIPSQSQALISPVDSSSDELKARQYIEHLKKQIQDLKKTQSEKQFFATDPGSNLINTENSSVLHQNILKCMKSSALESSGGEDKQSAIEFLQYQELLASSGQAMTEKAAAGLSPFGTFTSQPLSQGKSGAQTSTEKKQKKNHEKMIQKTLAAIDFLDKAKQDTSLSRVEEESKIEITENQIEVESNAPKHHFLQNLPKKSSSILKSQGSVKSRKSTMKAQATGVKFELDGIIQSVQSSEEEEDDSDSSMKIPIPPPPLKMKKKVSTVTDPRYAIGSFKSSSKSSSKRSIFSDKNSKLKDTFVLKAKKDDTGKSAKSMPQTAMEKRQSQIKIKKEAVDTTNSKQSESSEFSSAQLSDSDSNALPEDSEEELEDDLVSQASVTEEEYEEEVEEEVTDPEESKSDQDEDKASQLSGLSKMTQMRNAIVKDSTKAVVPDQYHHLFMDLDESESEKKRKPKAPLKRIKTIVIKKKAAIKRSEGGPEEGLAETKNSRKLRKLQSQQAMLKPKKKQNL